MPEAAPRRAWAVPNTDNTKPSQTMLNEIMNLGAVTIEAGELKAAVAAGAAAIGVGLIGLKACESVGRNPEASTKVLVQSIIAMALAEGLGLIALFL